MTTRNGIVIVLTWMLPIVLGNAQDASSSQVPRTVYIVTNMEVQVTVYEMCSNTMQTIHKQLQGLATNHPSFDEVGKTQPSFSTPCDKDKNKMFRICQSIMYRKNLRTKNLGPGPDGRAPAEAIRFIFGENSVHLNVYLVEGDLKVGKTMSFPLSVEFDGEELTLFYGMLEKPKNEELERRVRSVIEENAGRLRESLASFLATVDEKKGAKVQPGTKQEETKKKTE